MSFTPATGRSLERIEDEIVRDARRRRQQRTFGPSDTGAGCHLPDMASAQAALGKEIRRQWRRQKQQNQNPPARPGVTTVR
jgi:hypothetical protein